MAESQVVEYCPCCGGVDSDLFRICRCGGSEPTMAEVMTELKALREVCTRHAELLLALTNGGFPVIHKDMLAFIHEGEAVVPTGRFAELLAAQTPAPPSGPSPAEPSGSAPDGPLPHPPAG